MRLPVRRTRRRLYREQRRCSPVGRRLAPARNAQLARNRRSPLVCEKHASLTDGTRYDLLAHSIMPNHVHIVLRPLPKGDNESECHSLSQIMHTMKGYTSGSRESRARRTGAFWRHESLRTTTRADLPELERIVAYVIANPVKAGLVEQWRDCVDVMSHRCMDRRCSAIRLDCAEYSNPLNCSERRKQIENQERKSGGLRHILTPHSTARVCLPTFSPRSIPMKALGALSIPSTIVSSYLIFPRAQPLGHLANALRKRSAN